MYNYDELHQAIVKGNLNVAKTEVEKALQGGCNPDEIINNCMVEAMAEIGAAFEAGRAFVPNLLMSARAMKGALDILKPLMQKTQAQMLGKVVIGTVRGDLHDIGKNLVASMLEGSGFDVLNLGTDVSAEKFIAAARETQADLICLSALLTTTMGYMEEIVKAVETAGLKGKVKVMVGGAPITQEFADQIGADGYSANANAAVALAKRLMGKGHTNNSTR